MTAKSMKDYEIFRTEKTQLARTDLADLRGDPQVIGYGAVMIGREGEADVHIEFRTWHLAPGSVLMLFPGDVVSMDGATDTLSVEMLRYDSALLREASLQLEQTVYSRLRSDRCRGSAVAVEILEGMLALLRIYFRQDDCQCKDQLALYQLKSFFLGYYDWLVRHPEEVPPDRGSRRINELFSLFMARLEADHRISHDVAYYARQLHITPKYLNNVVHEVTGRTPKAIIDHYVTMQVKLQLRTTDISIKEMAWQYHFSDVSFFCRHFRQRTGMTPQEFRRQYREK